MELLDSVQTGNNNKIVEFKRGTSAGWLECPEMGHDLSRRKDVDAGSEFFAVDDELGLFGQVIH